MATTHLHKIVLLSTRFRLAGRSLLFARARLYPDRISLSGWSHRMAFKLVLPLDEIRHVCWPEADQGMVLITMKTGAQYALSLSETGRWHAMLDSRLRWGLGLGQRDRSPVAHLNLPLPDLIAYTTGMS